MTHKIRLIAIAVCALVLVAVGSAAAQSDNPIYNEVGFYVPDVIGERPHDPGAWTQGLLLHDGSLYESTGQYGESTLREVDPETGDVLRSISLDEELFAEGLARVDDRLIQLTWKAGKAFVYDLETFDLLDTIEYEGEGWGLCYDGSYLYMSDGTPFIDVRDPETFELIFAGAVTLQGQLVERINELECVGDYLYANVWQTDFILQIDKSNGVVVGLIDAEGLLTEEERSDPESTRDVLNGIVYLPESDTFLLTGKYWERMFEVTFVPAELPQQ